MPWDWFGENLVQLYRQIFCIKYLVSGILSAICIFVASHALAQDKHALLIANYKYADEVGELRNTRRDADLIASSLKSIGFPEGNIQIEENVTRDRLQQYVKEYTKRVKASGKGAVSFFYYSGHGAAASPGTGARRQGDNYLIPINVTSTQTVNFWDEALPLNEVGDTLSEARDATHFLVFDACRHTLKLPDRSADRKGFVPMRFTDHVGMLVAFASAPGHSAFDSVDPDDLNGPYAVALAEELAASRNADHLHLFSRVRTRVVNATNRRQIPWIRDGFLSLFFLNELDEQKLHRGEPPSDTSADCNCVTEPKPIRLANIIWKPLADANKLVFKKQTVTYAAARTDSGFLDQVNKNNVHKVARDSQLEVGKIDGNVSWYRYIRDRGSAAVRYVSAGDAEPR